LATGIRELDAMLHGGVLRGTTSVALGFSGSGKTTLGLHFLHTGAEAGEPGLLFGFYESPERVLQGGERVGLKLQKHAASGLLSHVWQPSYEFGLDRLGARLLAEVERIGAKRVVIDSLDGFRQAAIDPARTIRFITALLDELRARDITTLLTDETMKPSGPEMEMRIEGISALVENLFLLEYTTVGQRMRRLVSIVKQRASAHESTAREFFLTERGIEVAPEHASAAEVVAHATIIGTQQRRAAVRPKASEAARNDGAPHKRAGRRRRIRFARSAGADVSLAKGFSVSLPATARKRCETAASDSNLRRDHRLQDAQDGRQ
jgi:circadian clock protein KaiC